MSVVAENRKFLAKKGYVRNIFCGLKTMMCYCLVCEAYTWHAPLSRYPDYKYVCEDCKCWSEVQH